MADADELEVIFNFAAAAPAMSQPPSPLQNPIQRRTISVLFQQLTAVLVNGIKRSHVSIVLRSKFYNICTQQALDALLLSCSAWSFVVDAGGNCLLTVACPRFQGGHVDKLRSRDDQQRDKQRQVLELRFWLLLPLVPGEAR